MASALRLPDGGYMRHTDVQRILALVNEMKCVEIVGFSNLGKSALLRLLAQPDVWLRELGQAGSEFLPIYVDCNRMLELTDHGFYELVLRCLRESSPALEDVPSLTRAYEQLVTPVSEFQVPLSFDQGLDAALEATDKRLVFLFDEFDEPMAAIDSRVFLNLRAKKDRHDTRLVYVTATSRPLAELRTGNHTGEFFELFAHQRWRLAPLTRSDVAWYVRRYQEEHEVTFRGVDADFIYQWAGGHPVLLEGVCTILARLIRQAQERASEDAPEPWPIHREAVQAFQESQHLANECEKIWQGCTQAEQMTLHLLGLGRATDEKILARLRERHLVLEIDGEPRAFCRLFQEFIRARPGPTPSSSQRLVLDADSGAVLVDGQPVETLTRLEYRLMQLLYNNRGKIVDKYQIVTGVWGDEYIDSVDDARIEKLVSRLRQKIEPNSSHPQFLVTVRGRGYRLLVG